MENVAEGSMVGTRKNDKGMGLAWRVLWLHC